MRLFKDWLADFSEPPPTLTAEIHYLITKKTSDVPLRKLLPTNCIYHSLNTRNTESVYIQNLG